MAGIDDVLERLVTDPSFKERLARDPRTALREYTLSTDDVRLLAAQVSGDIGGLGAVEQRTSKSGLFGMLASMFGGGGGGGGPALTVEGGDLDDSSLGGGEGGGGGMGDGSEVSEAVMLERPGDDRGIVIDNSRGGPGGDGSEVADVVLQEQPAQDIGFVAPDVGDAEGLGAVEPAPGEDQGMIIDGGHSGPGDDVAFNPQPDPPGTDPFQVETTGGGGGGGDGSEVMDAVMLEQPGEDRGMVIDGGHSGPGDDVAFNPQPDPPGTDPFQVETTGGGGGSDADALMLKEVDPAPAHDGGSDADALMFKEVEPGTPAPGEIEGFVIEGGGEA